MLPRTVKDGFIIGVTQAVVLLAMLYGLVLLTGNQEQRSLEEISNGTRATVCVLALPVDGDTGRDQSLVEACLRDNGLIP